MTPLKALVVDDEALARSRMRTLLADCRVPPVQMEAEAANAVQAMEHLSRLPIDVLVLDIHMPGVDGLALAARVRAMPKPPALVFVTAHAEHAVAAFDLEAVDYLTKPVRLERLQAAMEKVQRFLISRESQQAAAQAEETIVIQDRMRTERVPLHEVIYFKAELKYVTVRTAHRSYILDGSLNDLEARYGSQYLRVHRNALVARRAIRAIEKHFDAVDGEGWAVRLDGIDELVAVSRRQLPSVRELIAQ